MGLGTLTAIKGGAMTFGRMDETHHDHLNTNETSQNQIVALVNVVIRLIRNSISSKHSST